MSDNRDGLEVNRVSPVYFPKEISHVFSQDPHGLQSLGVFFDIPFIESKRHVGIIRPDDEHFKTGKKGVHCHEGLGRSSTLGNGYGGTHFVAHQTRIGKSHHSCPIDQRLHLRRDIGKIRRRRQDNGICC